MRLNSFLKGMGSAFDSSPYVPQEDVDTPWIKNLYTHLYYGFTQAIKEAETTLEENQQAQQEFQFSGKEEELSSTK